MGVSNARRSPLDTIPELEQKLRKDVSACKKEKEEEIYRRRRQDKWEQKTCLSLSISSAFEAMPEMVDSRAWDASRVNICTG